MRWEKAARVVVACVGLGTAGAVYLLTRSRTTIGSAPVSSASDPAAKYQSGQGTEIRHDGNRQVGRSDYEAVRKYDDRVEWQKFKLILDDGTVLSADHVVGRFTGANREEPAEFTFEGQARFQSADGAALQGESGTYSDTTGVATVPGAASFTRGRMSGTGNGGTFARDTGVFKLLADARMTMAPDEGGAPIDASARSMTYLKSNKAMFFDQQARIARDAETLTADQSTVYLSDDEQRFRLIELRGHSRVTPSPGKVSDMPEMQADDIELGFHDGSQALQRASLHRRATMVQAGDQGKREITAPEINFVTAPDGKTLTRLEARDRVTVTLPASAAVPGRTITAATLVATGDDKNGLTAAIFEGGAEFVEKVPASPGKAESRRVGTSQRLGLTIKGQLDAIEAALFERDVKFTSGEVAGDADIGEYRATKGELELRPALRSQRRPRVTDADVVVEAVEFITVDLNTNDLHARKDVTTINRARKSAPASKRASAIFDESDPLYGTGAEFWYDATADRFRYVGTASARAQLKQTEDSKVLGNEVVFQQNTQDLNATGQVDSTFTMTGGPARAGGPAQAPTRYRATADALVYDDAKRTVTYRGAPAVLKNAENETNARVIVLILAKESRTVDRMEATEAVRSSLQQGRQALGDRLIYESATDAYRLWGKPLTLWTRETDGTCSSQNGNFVKFAGDVGAPDFPAVENPAGVTSSSKQTCPPFLATKK